MSTLKQVIANQLNSLKSTGPKSEEGKQTVGANAMIHGLRSSRVVLKTEEESEFLLLRQAVWAELKPANAVEDILVERIVLATWRLRRVMTIEVGMLNPRKREIWDSPMEEKDESQGPHQRFRGSAQSLGVLNRYEMSLERSLFKSLHELQRLQAQRMGLAVSLPAVLDITISNSS